MQNCLPVKQPHAPCGPRLQTRAPHSPSAAGQRRFRPLHPPPLRAGPDWPRLPRECHRLQPRSRLLQLPEPPAARWTTPGRDRRPVARRSRISFHAQSGPLALFVWPGRVARWPAWPAWCLHHSLQAHAAPAAPLRPPELAHAVDGHIRPDDAVDHPRMTAWRAQSSPPPSSHRF